MSDTITIKKNDLWKYATFLLAAVVIVQFFVIFGSEGTTGNVVANNPTAPTPAPTPTPQPSNIEVDISDAPVKGDANAPVTIIEFSDYQCPFCNRFWSQTLPQIEEQYIKTGKAKLVYMDFPLNQIHPEAAPAAQAAKCVRDQAGDDAYFEMHDFLFENYRTLSDANYKTWARQISGVDGAEFDSCLSSGKFAQSVSDDLAKGTAAGIRGTPSFVVNGQLVRGAVPFETFKATIDAAL